MGRLRAMAMGMAMRVPVMSVGVPVPVMSVVGGVVVRVGVSHAGMLYYNITGVQKLEGVKVSPRPPLPIQCFDFGENGSAQWREMRGHGFPDIGSRDVVVSVPVKVANITNGPPG